MARVVERGLRRTVGAPGLFATAYGNVGSSIYYALGLVVDDQYARRAHLAAEGWGTSGKLTANDVPSSRLD